MERDWRRAKKYIAIGRIKSSDGTRHGLSTVFQQADIRLIQQRRAGENNWKRKTQRVNAPNLHPLRGKEYTQAEDTKRSAKRKCTLTRGATWSGHSSCLRWGRGAPCGPCRSPWGTPRPPPGPPWDWAPSNRCCLWTPSPMEEIGREGA